MPKFCDFNLIFRVIGDGFFVRQSCEIITVCSMMKKLVLKLVFHFYLLMWRLKAGVWMSGSYWAAKMGPSHTVPESKISWNSIKEAFYAQQLIENIYFIVVKIK